MLKQIMKLTALLIFGLDGNFCVINFSYRQKFKTTLQFSSFIKNLNFLTRTTKHDQLIIAK